MEFPVHGVDGVGKILAIEIARDEVHSLGFLRACKVLQDCD